MLEQVTTAAFLHALYPDGLDGHLSLFCRTIDRTSTPVDWAASIDELIDHARHRKDAADVWWGVATRTEQLGPGKRGGAVDCKTITCLWADIDIAGAGHANLNLPATLEDAWKLLNACPLAPSIVVATGGGLHAYWLLQEPLSRDEAVGLLDRWAAMWLNLADGFGWHLDNVFNIDRVLRLPNTSNWKTGTARDVPIVHWEPDLRYGLDDLDPFLPAPAEPAAEREPWTGGTRPGDAFNAIVRANDILRRNGWTHHHTDREGDEHWTRPGKDVRKGQSATYYATDGHVTIWSDAIPGLETRRPYDSFGLYTLLEHGGDFTAASQQLGREGYGIRAFTAADLDDWVTHASHRPPEDVELPRFAGLIDWPTFWNVEHVDEEWLIYPVLAKGRAHALYAPAKAGKSLLALEVAAAAATGRPVLGQAAGQPIVVAYVDFEMTEADVYERLVDLGYGPDDDLSKLHYYLLPDLPALDTVNGGMLLLSEMQRIGAELVVVDTVSRSISGAENDADTIINLARYTFTPLKRAGITSLRVDHSGKNIESGQRGTSAKNDDVDVVWRLTVADNGVTIKATHRRLEWVPEVVVLTRTENPLSHQIDPEGVEWVIGTLECMEDLDRLAVPLDVSVRQAGKLLREAGKGRKTNVVRSAVKQRRAKAVDNFVDDASSVSRQFGKRENDPETDYRETLEDM